MNRISIGLILGIIVTLSIGATYKVVVSADSYTRELDPNDMIFKARSEKNLDIWFMNFGACERTVIFYNLAGFADKIDKLEKQVFTTTTAIDINEPAKKEKKK